MLSAAFLAGLFTWVAAAAGTLRPSAVVQAGTIIGVRTSLPSSTAAVNKFVGIPYAEAPLGSKRFMPPVPLATFDANPFNATRPVRACYQQSGSESALLARIVAQANLGQQSNLETIVLMRVKTVYSSTCTLQRAVQKQDCLCCSGFMAGTYRMATLGSLLLTVQVSSPTMTSWL